MIVPVMAISNLVLTQQIYSEETNRAHAHYREPVPLKGHFCLCWRCVPRVILRQGTLSVLAKIQVGKCPTTRKKVDC